MTLTGKPSVIEPRPSLMGDASAALRPLQGTVAAIRERLRLIEIEINALLAAASGGGAASADIDDLQSQINALRARIEALEADSPTEWYVNDALVGIRNRVNFRNGGDIVVVGEDDGPNDQVIITFDSVIGLTIERGSLVLSGSEIALAGAITSLAVERGELALRGSSLALSAALPVAPASLSLSGREVGLDVGQAVNIAVTRQSLALQGRTVGTAVTGNLVVQPGRIALLGRDVLVLPGTLELLLHLDGADGATTFQDSSPNARDGTAVDNAQIDTAQSKFGGASLLLDGAGDSITLGGTALAVLSGGDYTVEAFIRLAAAPSTIYGAVIVAHDSTANGWLVRVQQNATNLELVYPGLASISAGGAVSLNTWHHVAFCRAGTQHYIALNGTVTPVSLSNRTADIVATRRVGASNVAAAEGYLNGWIDELRIVSGAALYTSNFTPPSTPFSP